MKKNDSSHTYSSYLTASGFLYYEMKAISELFKDGLNETHIIKKVIDDNLFQYPTEKRIRRICLCCLKRCKFLNNHDLVIRISQGDELSKQIILYSIMKTDRFFREFMIDVIGRKYRERDFTFSRDDINTFFNNISEQDDRVSSWSNITINQLRSYLTRILEEIGYVDRYDEGKLFPVIIDPYLKKNIIAAGDFKYLQAFFERENTWI